MTTHTLVKIVEAIPRFANLAFQTPISWSINSGQHWAIVGANGAGKSLLIDVLTGKHALKSGTVETANNASITSIVKRVAFSDIYSIVDTQNSYYQQRWNTSCEAEAPIVESLFERGDQVWVEQLVNAFGITDLIDKEINQLSSGELRKTLIVRSLLSKPRVLILDNPFIGLDVESRKCLNQLFKRLSEWDGIQIVLVVSDPRDIPDTITHILPIKNKALLAPLSREAFIGNRELQKTLFEKETEACINHMPTNVCQEEKQYSNTLVFKDIHIKYGKKTILKALDWKIGRGEKWALLGENGSGKSTLLSLVAADNPQAYANDISLFDRKRGSGESIWDIKKHIGYISPEMHLYYLKNVSCLDVVGSGFFDTIGLYRKCSAEQELIASDWMRLFGIEQIKDTSFLNISTGEQRLVLLARVFVKNPDLLILDEPLHGLDVENKKRIIRIIENFCNESKSLIYVTHYEEEIPNIVSQRLVLKKIRD